MSLPHARLSIQMKGAFQTCSAHMRQPWVFVGKREWWSMWILEDAGWTLYYDIEVRDTLLPPEPK